MTTNERKIAVKKLKDLLHVDVDGQKLCETAGASADPDDREVFGEVAAMHARHVAQIEQEIERWGEPEPMSGTMAGAVRRGWLNMWASIADGKRATLLSGLERGEDRLKARYIDALRDLPESEARPLVADQYEEVLRAHDRIRDLRDEAIASDRAGRHLGDSVDDDDWNDR